MDLIIPIGSIVAIVLLILWSVFESNDKYDGSYKMPDPLQSSLRFGWGSMVSDSPSHSKKEWNWWAVAMLLLLVATVLYLAIKEPRVTTPFFDPRNARWAR